MDSPAPAGSNKVKFIVLGVVVVVVLVLGGLTVQKVLFPETTDADLTVLDPLPAGIAQKAVYEDDCVTGGSNSGYVNAFVTYDVDGADADEAVETFGALLEDRGFTVEPQTTGGYQPWATIQASDDDQIAFVGTAEAFDGFVDANPDTDEGKASEASMAKLAEPAEQRVVMLIHADKGC